MAAHLDCLVTMVRSNQPDLTDRQKTTLLKVYLDDRDQTVRGLAAYMNVSKPVITRALDRLTHFDLVRRKTDPLDRRSVIVQRTKPGQTFMRDFGELVVRASLAN